jgi:L-ascorbate metabolism protein UlaG (beta-lactamase superfamily)
LFDSGKSLWGSFLVQTPEGNIYVAGDTAYGDHFKRIYEVFGPIRLALLSVGAFTKRHVLLSCKLNNMMSIRKVLKLAWRCLLAFDDHALPSTSHNRLETASE